MVNKDFDERHNVTPGRHLYQFYKGNEDYFSAMLSYFQSGLEQGDACLWLISEKHNLDEVKAMAEARIPNLRSFLDYGQLNMESAERWYLKDGRFNEEQAVENATNYIRNALMKGFKRVRGAGDSAAVPPEDRDKLHNYEHKIDEVIKCAPVIALCAYPILDCSLQDTRNIIESHDDVLIGHL